MPTGYSYTATSNYQLNCLVGCTASANVAATTAVSNVITWDDCFTKNIAAGTYIDLYIKGWTNAATETIYTLSFQTVWKAANDYAIDKF